MTRIELVTSPLPRECSATELHGRIAFWSGRRGSNPRPSAWKADALPLSYSRWRWWADVDSNHGRHSQRVYSPPPLATRASAQKTYIEGSWRWESNPQPAAYKTAALPIEPRQRRGNSAKAGIIRPSRRVKGAGRRSPAWRRCPAAQHRTPRAPARGRSQRCHPGVPPRGRPARPPPATVRSSRSWQT